MSKDSGVSVVIAFVTILTIVAIAVGMWALIGIPGQIREANEAHVITVTDSMTDYKVMLDNLHKDEFKNLNVSTLLPVGSLYSGQIRLDNTKAGTLELVMNGDATLWGQDVNRFTISSGTSEIGYEGGGVYRNDNGNYVWSVFPELEIYNASSNLLKITIDDVSNINGDFSLGTSGEIAVNTQYLNSNDRNGNINVTGSYYSGEENTGTEQNFTIRYTSSLTKGAAEDTALWYSLFYEAYSRYKLSGEFNSDNLSVDPPRLNGNVVSIMIHSINTIMADAYYNGYTYKAELVPEYIVKGADLVIDGVGYYYNNKIDEDEIAEIVSSIMNGGRYTFTKGYVYKVNDNDWVCISDGLEVDSNNFDTNIDDYFSASEHDDEFIKVNKESVYYQSNFDTVNSWSTPKPTKGSICLGDDNNIYIYVTNSECNSPITTEDDWIKIAEA